MIKKIQKYLVIGSIVTVGITMAMLISALFKAPIFKNHILTSILLTFAILCADCFFTNAALNVLKKTKVLSIISIAMLNIACVLGLICIWIGLGFDKEVAEAFSRFVGIIAVTACFFTLIVSTNAKLAGHYKVLKTIYYILIILVDLVIIFALIGEKTSLFEIDGFTTIFVAVCLAVFTLMCVCTILGKKVHTEDSEIDESYIKIKKTEYDDLIDRLEALKQENQELKEQLNNKQESNNE